MIRKLKGALKWAFKDVVFMCLSLNMFSMGVQKCVENANADTIFITETTKRCILEPSTCSVPEQQAAMDSFMKRSNFYLAWMQVGMVTSAMGMRMVRRKNQEDADNDQGGGMPVLSR